MPEELTVEEQKTLEKLSEFVANELAEGKEQKKIAEELVKQGLSEEAALNFVQGVCQAIEEYKETPEGHRIMASKYKRHMIYGILWAAGGTAVTIGTYNAASEGGVYFVFWGAILWGIIDFFRGLFGWLKYKN